MPPLESTFKLATGSPCPAFRLRDVASGRMVGRDDFAGMPLMVAFICNHCPFVKHIRTELAALADAFSAHYGERFALPAPSNAAGGPP
jgi:hypothetical protein